MRARWTARSAIGIGLIVVLAGCTGLELPGFGVVPGARTAVPTFRVLRGTPERPVSCEAFGLVDPVEGTLRGAAIDEERVWLEHPDHGRISVRWPEGFSVGFEPGAVLYDERGVAVAREGERVELGQGAWKDQAGTPGDPYLASGLVFSGCYVPVRG